MLLLHEFPFKTLSKNRNWSEQWHNFFKLHINTRVNYPGPVWRWKKWHWLNPIPERWHHSPPWWGCVRIGRTSRPIKEHTHGKSFKKIRKSVGKLSKSLHQQVRARLGRIIILLIKRKEKGGKKIPADLLGTFSACFPCLVRTESSNLLLHF